MRVIVCGGRVLHDVDLVFDALDRFRRDNGISCVIQGGASGADKLASRWARAREVPQVQVDALWHVHGPAAGPIRNQTMLEHQRADAVIAFAGGRGTADMVRRARRAGVPVVEVPSAEVPF